MLTTVLALTPVFLVIALGYVLYRLEVMGEAMWPALERLCFYVLFPALLIKTIGTAEFTEIPLGTLAIAMLLAVATMCVLLLILKPFTHTVLGMSDASFSSIFQGATRWHGFVALAIVLALYDEPGVVVVALAIAIKVPLINLLTVVVLAVWGEGEIKSPGRILKEIALNPLIIGCVVGLLINLSGLELAEPFLSTLNIVGRAALGLSLITVGAGLRLGMIRETRYNVALGVFLRLLVMPAIMYGFALMFGIEGLSRTVAVICFAVPTAASSYIMARQMGGDAALMANIITAQVLAATATLPLVIWLAQ